MKSVILFLFATLFTVLGTAAIAVDLFFNHSLHVMNGSVGGGLLLTAVALLMPVQFDHLAEKLGPYLPGRSSVTEEKPNI